jgi:hypothetical protein
MAKLSTKNVIGTSYHNDTVTCSVNDLKTILGEPECEDNTGEDKVNFEWICETDKGDVFTIYDWKEYRKLNGDEYIEWHIGGHNKDVTYQAKIELNDMIYLATKNGTIK